MRGIVVAECQTTTCPVDEIRLTVHERPAGKVLQPPLKCPRCGMET